MIYSSPQNAAFFLYLLKITNTKTGEVLFKLGKANDVYSRFKKWKKELTKITSLNVVNIDNYKIELVWYHQAWYTDVSSKKKYYMTKNEELSGNDADDIFRGLLKEQYNVNTYDIIINDEMFTDEGVDFKTQDIDKIKEILKLCYNNWVDSITSRTSTKGSTYVCITILSEKQKAKIKEEFSDIQYNYQEKAVNKIYNWLSTGDNTDYLYRIPCGGGKTSISLAACSRLSVENGYTPILLLAGLKSVFTAFNDDTIKYKYNGVIVECYDIKKITKEQIDENRNNHIVTLIYTTCQAARKRESDYDNEDLVFDNKLSDRLEHVLNTGITFSSIITDECHKIIFGDKMKEIYPYIRKYHENKLNIIHLSGTGFNVENKDSTNLTLNRFAFITEKEVRSAQGSAAVNRHYIVCRNDDFLKYFEEHLCNGWDYILNGSISSVNNITGVNTIQCISTIHSGLEKPVICAYLSSVDIVKKSFDYLSKKYSYDDALIISANGCSKSQDTFIRNTNHSDGYVKLLKEDVKDEISKYANKGKLVILLNVDKFVESWTIKEMNVQLILRNIQSPDTFGQAISRGSRIYVEKSNVIKKDVYIFFYGSTFIEMTYQLFMRKFYHRVDIGKHGSGNLKDGGSTRRKAWEKSIGDVFDKDSTIHIGDKIYSYEENNLNDFRDIIFSHRIKTSGSSEVLVKSISGLFPGGELEKSFSGFSIEHIVRMNTNKKVRINTVDGDGNNCQHCGNKNISNTNKEQCKQTFEDKFNTIIYILLATRISKFGLIKDVDYDDLYISACYDYNTQLSDVYDNISNVLGEDAHKSIKKIIMDWIETVYSI